MTKDEELRKPFYLIKRERKKGKPVWCVRFRDPKSGEILTARSSGQTNKTAAEAWARRELERMAEPPKSPITLREWAKPFYTEACPHVTRLALEGKHFADKTLTDHHRTIETYLLNDPLADSLLSDIRRADILAFRDRLVIAAGRTRTTQKTLGILKVIMREAVFRELIVGDPTAGIGAIRYEVKERAAISAKGVQALLDPKHWKDPLFLRATTIAAMTGLRAGEVRGLQWGDLMPGKGEAAGIIFIRRALSGDASEPDLPKWGKTRSCPYPKALEAILEPLRGKAEAWVLSRGGGPIGYGKWALAVKAAAKGAELEGVTLHVLRHSLNTALRGAGQNDELLRGAFGWSGPEVQEGYTHRSGYDYSGLGKAIDDLFKEEPHD